MTNPEIADQPADPTVAEDAPVTTSAPEDADTAQPAAGEGGSEPAPRTSRPVASDARAQTVGRRKEAIVRVRLIPGSGVRDIAKEPALIPALITQGIVRKIACQ